MKKRFLSVMLSCLLVCSFVPTAAIAEEIEGTLAESTALTDSAAPNESSADATQPGTQPDTTSGATSKANAPGENDYKTAIGHTSPSDTASVEATVDSGENATTGQTNNSLDVSANGAGADVINSAADDGATDAEDDETGFQNESLDATSQVEGEDLVTATTLVAGAEVAAQETIRGNITLKFREKSAPFLDINTANNMWVTWENVPTGSPFDYTIELKSPSGTVPIDASSIQVVGSKKDSWLWSLPNDQLREGTWTVTVTKAGVEGSATASLTMRKVVFHTGEQGSFNGNGATYNGYCCVEGNDNVFTIYFNLPTVTAKEEGQALTGWSKKQDDTSKESMLDSWGVRAGDFDTSNVLNLYAVYGEKKTNSFSFTELTNSETKEIKNGETIDLGEVDPGYADDVVAKKFKFTNTGNQPVDFTFIIPDNFNFVFKTTNGDDLKDVHLDANENKELEFTIQPKKGLSTGSYTGTFQFRYNGAIYTYTLQVRVTSAKYRISVKDGIEKTYGEVWTQENIIDRITATSDKAGAQGNVDYKNLGLQLNNPGFASTAEVNNEGYAYSLTNSTIVGVEAELVEDPKLKVVPATITDYTISPVTAHIGQMLGEVSLSGTFKHNGVDVAGELSWSSEDQDKTLNDPGTLENVTWIFTPSSKNYKPLSGTTSVTFTNLEETTLTVGADAQTSVVYDGKAHPVTFTCNRDGKITVQYRLQGQDPEAEWTTNAPTAAGTYEVQANVPKNNQYASATLNTMLVITPLEAKFSYEASSKPYDGNTNAKDPKVWITNKVGNDNVTAVFEAAFDSKDAGTNRLVIFRVTGFEGSDSGNYKLPAKTEYHYNSVIGKLNVTITGDLTKVYGQNLEGLDLDELNTSQGSEAIKVDGLVGSDSATDLGVVFSCDGFAPTADAGKTYPITATLNTPNYQFSSIGGNVEVGKLTVNKATPVLRGNVTVGLARKNCELDHVALAGEFVNPYSSDMVVGGTFGWKSPSTKLPDVDTYNAEWIFTLDPSAATNYEQPEGGTVTITLIDQEPFPLSAEAQVAPYNGSPQAYTSYKAESSEGEKPARVDISYRKHSDLATVSLLSLQEVGDDWTSEQPVDAGTYDVRVAATPESGSEYASNSIETLFTITPIVPTFDASQAVEAPEGTALSDASITEKLAKPWGIDGNPLDGIFTWSTPDAVVSDDGETFSWTFTPASFNYTSVTGEATFTLAPDERAITGTVYNLPNSLGLQDYAVVDVEASGLKLGDEVTLFTYNEDGTINPESVPTPVVEEDLKDGKLNVELDGDALDASGGTIYARITSSKKNEPVTLEYGPEPQLSLLADGSSLENNLISILMGASARVSVDGLDTLGGYEFLDVSYNAAATSGSVACEQNDRVATVTVEAANTDATLEVIVKLKHPDPAKSGEEIVFTLTARVFGHGGTDEKVDNDEILSGGLAVNGPSLVDAVLSDDEVDDAVAQGYVVDVLLSVKAIDETQVNPTDKAEAEAALEANDYTLGQYMDIDLTKIKKSSITEQEATSIHETNHPVGITVNVPDALKQQLLDESEGIRFKDFAVLRVHDDGATIETAILNDLDNDPATVTFESDRFSTYALIYRDSDERGGLSISNEVVGNEADPDQEFSYTLTVDYGEDTITGTYGELEFKDGTATFTLKGGQSVTTDNLPAGGRYSVTQEANDDYATQQTGATGSIVSGKTIEATFTNQRDIFDITFDANGGTVNCAENATVQTQPNGTLGVLPQAVRDGFVFDGWFTAVEGGERVVDGASFNANTSLFAHWSKAPAPTPPGTDPSNPKTKSEPALPKTGDSTALPLYFTMAVGSALTALVAVGALRRRRKAADHIHRI